MDLANEILLFVLIVLKVSTPTLTTDPEPEHEYDITEYLNEAIVKVFQGVNSSSAIRLVSQMRNDGKGKYQCNNVQKLRPFSTKLYLRNINISLWEPESTPKIFCEYNKNKVRIFNDELVFNVVGFVDISTKRTYASFKTIVKFKYITIAGGETRSSPFNSKLQIDFVYKQLLYNQLTLPWTAEHFTYKKKELLIKMIKSTIPPIIQDNLNNNEKFVQAIHSSFCYRPMQKIVTSYPSVLIDEEGYFYSIPKVTFYGVNLVNVKIKGLTNFESLKPNTTFGKSAYTLIVKRVRGSMNLDNKAFQNLKFYEMTFNVESLFITVDFETKRLVVEARNYAVLQTSTDPPRVSVFSTAIMHSIESAIASVLMSALEVPELNERDDESFNHESETSAEQTMPDLPSNPTIRTTKSSPTPQKSRTIESSTRLQTTTQTSLKTDVKVCKSSPSDSPALRIITKTPSRDNTPTTESAQDEESSNEEIITELSEDFDTNIQKFIARNDTETETKPTEDVEEDAYDYDITFHNVSIKLMQGTPYPKKIQCDLFKALKIDYYVNAMPSGNIQLGNKGKAININFHANFTEIKISVEKQTNGSKENETCHFQIYSNQEIKVISPPKKNTTSLDEDLKTKKKIESTGISLMKERFTRTVKPLVCLPFDFCSHSVQILDDFFQSFVDKVLKKGSFRRNTTLTT